MCKHDDNRGGIMNNNISQETYSYINSTLETLRNEIMYINDRETRQSLMEQRNVMKRIIDGHPFQCRSPTRRPNHGHYLN